VRASSYVDMVYLCHVTRVTLGDTGVSSTHREPPIRVVKYHLHIGRHNSMTCAFLQTQRYNILKVWLHIRRLCGFKETDGVKFCQNTHISSIAAMAPQSQEPELSSLPSKQLGPGSSTISLPCLPCGFVHMQLHFGRVLPMHRRRYYRGIQIVGLIPTKPSWEVITQPQQTGHYGNLAMAYHET
jgi:hypothetical protein